MPVTQAPTSAPPTLLSLPTGAAATIRQIHAQGSMRRRLLDLGLTLQATAVHLFDAPSGDPRAYLIRSTVIALRNADAATVEIVPPSGDAWEPSKERGDSAWV